jgi:hypothetical protein
MTTTLLTAGVWPELTRAVRGSQGPVCAAVPYFSQAGSRMLPLKRGDILVVIASDATVASGQTCPSALRRLLNKGVKVYSLENLHAKVFVLGRTAYVGSANVSASSKEHLVEAVVAIHDRNTVAAAKSFVSGLCESRVTHTELDRLAAIYRPPRGGADTKTVQAKKQPRLWIAHIAYEDLDPLFVPALRKGRTVAKTKKTDRRRYVDELWWTGEKAFAVGDSVIQLYTYEDGNVEIFPPGKVIERKTVRKGNRCKTFVYLETPNDCGIPYLEARKQLGQAVTRRLRRDGPLGSGVIRERLLGYLATHT